VVCIAIGDKSQQELAYAMKELRKYCALPVHVVDGVVPGTGMELGDNRTRSRWAKVNLDLLSPYPQFLYLDADTRVRGDIRAGFKLLDRGWDIAMAPSENQGAEAFWHVGQQEKLATVEEVQEAAIQMQAGVMFVNRDSDRVKALFETWREEWLRWMGEDQAAFVRALHRSPAAIALLGRPWNGGALVNHLFGRTRERTWS
jgi:hypothetical protein